MNSQALHIYFLIPSGIDNKKVTSRTRDKEESETRSKLIGIISFTFLLLGSSVALSQTEGVHGQVSGWLNSNPEKSIISQAGLRYIPELFIEEKIGDGDLLNAELSINSFITGSFNDKNTVQCEVKPYRVWGRFATSTFEARLGLQKINFGSATLFRPLMWFDRIDPRDPLQLTDGVYGLLLRYYFLNNANIWLWGLYGNEETKGWEIAPTKKGSIEYGGRVQTPLSTGELGITYHHRQADLTRITQLTNIQNGAISPEDRLGLDGKWDVGIGVWFEAVLTHQQTEISGMKYQHQGTIGVDYTFDVGNGLNIVTEYFKSETADKAFSSGKGIDFSALLVNYPLSVIDNLSAILYRDWKNQEWYRLITCRRIYDNWSLYLIIFWNPDKMHLYNNQTNGNPFAGKGFQFMITFNH